MKFASWRNSGWKRTISLSIMLSLKHFTASSWPLSASSMAVCMQTHTLLSRAWSHTQMRVSMSRVWRGSFQFRNPNLLNIFFEMHCKRLGYSLPPTRQLASFGKIGDFFALGVGIWELSGQSPKPCPPTTQIQITDLPILLLKFIGWTSWTLLVRLDMQLVLLTPVSLGIYWHHQLCLIASVERW